MQRNVIRNIMHYYIMSMIFNFVMFRNVMLCIVNLGSCHGLCHTIMSCYVLCMSCHVMYVCMHVCVRACIYIYVCVCVCVRVYKYVCVHRCHIMDVHPHGVVQKQGMPFYVVGNQEL